MFGKEAALLVPTGTMGNLIASKYGNYAPNFEEGHIGFGLFIRPSVHQYETCIPYLMNHACWSFEISYMDYSWKIAEHVFFFLSKLSPFLELCPFEKNQTEILSARCLEKYFS